MLITIIRGDNENLQVTFTDNDGNAIDLTGATVYFTVKANKLDDDDDALIKKDVTSFASPEDGIAIISLTPDNTNLDIGHYFYDIQLKKSDGAISSASAGVFAVKQDITTRTS